MNTRPLILISNDDGYGAKGIEQLMEFVAPFGDIITVCPENQHSGQSMAITVDQPLRIRQRPDYKTAKIYTVNGTPVDCVKISLLQLLDRKPSIILAGINHGSNASVNVNYSGTMGAVSEGCVFSIPSIGFSLTDHNPDADFLPAKQFIQTITQHTLQNGLPDGVCLNVNIPHIPSPKGIKIVRDCKGRWSDEYQQYIDPAGHKFYMLAGNFINEEPHATDTDLYALSQGYVSVVPTIIDRTARNIPQWLKNLQ